MTTKYDSWTPTAIECYKSGINCTSCNLLDELNLEKDKCNMKHAVFELVGTIGAPQGVHQPTILEANRKVKK